MFDHMPKIVGVM